MDVERNELNAGSVGLSKVSKKATIVRTLTGNDIIYWGADSFISVALALFVVTFIDGATVLNVGIALMIYRIVNALASLPIGRFFDRHKGLLDEATGLSLACLASGTIYVLLSFSTEVWQLYLAMVALGFSAAINLASWRILFYSHVDREQMGQTMGIYQMLYSLGVSFLLALGGFVGEQFGYAQVLFYGGLLMMIGSMLPFLIRGYFTDKS